MACIASSFTGSVAALKATKVTVRARARLPRAATPVALRSIGVFNERFHRAFATRASRVASRDARDSRRITRGKGSVDAPRDRFFARASRIARRAPGLGRIRRDEISRGVSSLSLQTEAVITARGKRNISLLYLSPLSPRSSS
jgi:hypothetical protein